MLLQLFDGINLLKKNSTLEAFIVDARQCHDLTSYSNISFNSESTSRMKLNELHDNLLLMVKCCVVILILMMILIYIGACSLMDKYTQHFALQWKFPCVYVCILLSSRGEEKTPRNVNIFLFIHLHTHGSRPDETIIFHRSK